MGVYSVKSAYEFIQGSVESEDQTVFKSLWDIAAPTNVIVFV